MASVAPDLTLKGINEEPVPVWTFIKAPVPVALASLVKVNKSFVPVPVAQLNKVVYVECSKDKSAVGSFRPDQGNSVAPVAVSACFALIA
jgi:hypothetical protein